MLFELPPELILHILSFLKYENLIQFSKVSSAANTINEDPCLLIKMGAEKLALEEKEVRMLFASENIPATKQLKLKLVRAYEDLFKIPGNNFHNLIKSKEITLVEIHKKLTNFVDKSHENSYFGMRFYPGEEGFVCYSKESFFSGKIILVNQQTYHKCKQYKRFLALVCKNVLNKPLHYVQVIFLKFRNILQRVEPLKKKRRKLILKFQMKPKLIFALYYNSE